AWVLVRYEFPLKGLLDSLVDLPFALPTAVAGLVYSDLFVARGWYGRFLVPLGIQGAYSRLGIVLVLVFIGFPFVVRTLQPVLEGLDRDVEEAAACLGANRLQTVLRVIFPSILPAVAVMTFFVVVPLVNVFVQALAGGVGVYWRNLSGDADTLHSIKLTLIVAPIAVGLNVTFGIAAAWAIARFRFPGRTLLTALIDLPFTVSPVVVGLFLLLLFGLQGTFGPGLRSPDLKIVFALP